MFTMSLLPLWFQTFQELNIPEITREPSQKYSDRLDVFPGYSGYNHHP